MKNKKLLSLIALIIASFTYKNGLFQTSNKSYIITRHAQCRMDCRKISKQDIDDILAQKKVNKRKSDPRGRPCPTTALEGFASKDKQHIRVITAHCKDSLKIVTVIDLDRKYSCHCD